MKNNFTILLESLLSKVDNEQEKFDKRHSAYLRYDARSSNTLSSLNKLGKVSNLKTHQNNIFTHHLVLPRLFDNTGRFAPGDIMIPTNRINSRTISTWNNNSFHYNIYSEIPADPKQNPVSIEEAQLLIDKSREVLLHLIEVSKRPTIKLKDIDIPEDVSLDNINIPDIKIEKRTKEPKNIVTIKRDHVNGPKRSIGELTHLFVKVNNNNFNKKKNTPELFLQIEEIENELKLYGKYFDIKYTPYNKNKYKSKK